jgi:hypothetical protein
MEYILYTDSPKLFSCNVDISGASLSDTKARMFLETKDFNLVFNGTINSSGVCEVTIPKLDGLVREGLSGKVKLEIIAENTVFTPWESDAVIRVNKKVTVSEIKMDTTSNPTTNSINETTKSVNVKVTLPTENKVKQKPKLTEQEVLNYANKLKKIIEVNSKNEFTNTTNILTTYSKMHNISPIDMKRIKQILK